MGLAALVIPDAGSASQLAWLGAGLATLFLAVGLVSGSLTAVHAAIALLGAMFLLRDDSRLLLAAPYGTALLLLEDLGARTIERIGVSHVEVALIGVQIRTALVLAAIGAFAAAATALAVTGAPGRSVGMTALGAVAAVVAFAAVARWARQRYGSGAEVPPGDDAPGGGAGPEAAR